MPRKKLSTTGFELIGLALDSKTGMPISRMVKMVAKIGNSYRKSFLENKLTTFLTTIDGRSDKERVQMMKIIDDDWDAFYERLWHIIDQNDSVYKTGIIARLTKAFARKKIPLDTFYILCKMVNDAHTSDLRWAYGRVMEKGPHRDNIEVKKIHFPITQRLASVGFSQISSAYTITNEGKLVMTFGFEKEPDFNTARL
jgi:hypothetical protein